MTKIVAPNKEYEGISAGVKFSKGVGDCTDPYLIDWFKSKGYEVVLDAAELELPVPDPTENTEPELKVELEPVEVEETMEEEFIADVEQVKDQLDEPKKPSSTEPKRSKK